MQLTLIRIFFVAAAVDTRSAQESGLAASSSCHTFHEVRAVLSL